MGIISYAQNFEDVMLWRALSDVKDGFYIDVGANDPEELSVTKAFYDHGWHGINVEPLRQYYDLLCQKRPRDINLRVALGDKTSEAVIYEIEDTGLSTLDHSIAESHVNRGFKVVESSISVRTLADVCRENVHGEIHFLKIDVEGFETQVIKGADFQSFRPWLIIVEATKPLDSALADFPGEAMLLRQGYQKIYFDGLNNFYIAQEKAKELAPYFAVPPNVFDEYTLASLVKERRACETLSSEMEKLRGKYTALSDAYDHLQSEHEQLSVERDSILKHNDNLLVELDAILKSNKDLFNERNNLLNEKNDLTAERDALWQANEAWQHSLSFRVTKPLRWGKRLVKRPVKAVLVALMGVVLKNPALKNTCKGILAHFPRLSGRLHGIWVNRQLPMAITSSESIDIHAAEEPIIEDFVARLKKAAKEGKR